MKARKPPIHIGYEQHKNKIYQTQYTACQQEPQN